MGVAETENAYRERFAWDRATWGSHCANCLATCTYRVYSCEGGVVWEEQSGTLTPTEEGVPDRNPMGCQKGAAWHRQLDSDDRLLYPLRRVGERGSGEWERISWDEALRAVADAVLDAVEEFGPEAVVVDESSEGGMLSITGQTRFASGIGAVSLDAIASVNDFCAGHYITFGHIMGGSTADDTFHSELVLVWHANPAYTRIPYFHYLSEARYNGAEIVLIGPDFSPSGVHADTYVPVEAGTDAALALSMCHVVVNEGLVDEDFVRTQTDLALLVDVSSGRLLRESDMAAGGSEFGFYVWDPVDGAVGAPHDRLAFERDPALRGRFEVGLADGSTIGVVPVYELLLSRLEDYSPETASRTCGVHPGTIRSLARTVATRRTKLHEGFDTAKHYHGDLMERSMDLLLALTGNWGRKGTGHDTYTTYPFDGAYLGSLKTGSGIEAAEAALSAARMMFGTPEDEDAVPPPLQRPGVWDLMGMIAAQGSSVPPFLFWLNHCGYGEVWDRADWAGSPRPFREYLEEALPTWAPQNRPGPGVTPRVLIEGATNALRRTRGGARMLLENLWPGLSLVVSIDQRINSAALHADILLPAAHEAERVNLQYPMGHSFEVVLSDKAVEPAGEARTDWQIYAALSDAIAERAVERGLGERVVGAAQRPLSEVGAAFSGHGSLRRDEDVVDELLRDTALSGVIDIGTSLATMRTTGWTQVKGNGSLPLGRWLGSPIREGETFSAARWHVEDAMPYATTTGRATFYVDHPWFLEAGEALPCHKDPPPIGGDHPFVLTGGHPRWSIHACNATNPVILETTRGHPTLVMNPADAAARGIGDEDVVELRNDLGSLTVAVRIGSSPRPGQVILYAAWEAYGFDGWSDGTQVEAGMVKWLHLANGWGHLRFMNMQWQPCQFDRVHRVDVVPLQDA